VDVVDKGLADWSNEWGGGREWGVGPATR